MRYVLVYVAFSPDEAPVSFLEGLSNHPSLFLKRKQWDNLTAFEVFGALGGIERASSD